MRKISKVLPTKEAWRTKGKPSPLLTEQTVSACGIASLRQL